MLDSLRTEEYERIALPTEAALGMPGALVMAFSPVLEPMALGMDWNLVLGLALERVRGMPLSVVDARECDFTPLTTLGAALPASCLNFLLERSSECSLCPNSTADISVSSYTKCRDKRAH